MLGTRSAGTTGELAGRTLILEAAGTAAESTLRTRGKAGTANRASLVAPIEDGTAALNSGASSVRPRRRSSRRRRWRRGLVDGTWACLRHDYLARSRYSWSRENAHYFGGRYLGLRRDVQSRTIGGCRGRDRSGGNRRGGCSGRFSHCRGRRLYGRLGCRGCLGRLCNSDSGGRWGFRFGCNNPGRRHNNGSRRDGRRRWFDYNSSGGRCNGNGRTRRGCSRQGSGRRTRRTGGRAGDDNSA